MSPPLVSPSSTKPPLIFVTHLPSASSFYASILQPLGLQFLSSPPLLSPSASGAVLNYGYVGSSTAGPKHVVLFSITQVPPGAFIRPARITLSAGSEQAVKNFYAKSEILNIGSRTRGKLEFFPSVEPGEGEGDSIDIRAVTRDFDSNMLEAVFRSRNDNRGAMYRGPSGRVREIETASSEKESRRVLEWQEQVARSINEGSVISGGGSEAGYRRGPPSLQRRSESYPVPGQPLRLVRRETVTTEHYRRPDERDGGGERGGISGKAVIGTLLGAAAGAAFAYAMVHSESPPRLAPRRASYGGSHSQSGGHYTHTGGRDHAVERIPARSYVSARSESARPRYVDYIAAAPRIAQIDDKSYHSGSQRTGRSATASRTRSRSEVGPRYERPLTILPAQSVRARSPGSHLSHRSGYKTESRRERSPGRSSRQTGSHVSSRSYHSVSTAKPPISTTKIRVVPGERERRVMHSGLEREVDRRNSVVERARQVPLPMSVVGGYAGSVAPSDSVSSIGTKRERERLMSRMSYGSGVPRGW